jgi:hypothetical protein
VTSASSSPVLARLPYGTACALTLVGLAAGEAWVATEPPWVAMIVAFGLIGVPSGMLDSLGARFLAVSCSVSRAGLAAGSYGVGAGFLIGAAVAPSGSGHHRRGDLNPVLPTSGFRSPERVRPRLAPR